MAEFLLIPALVMGVIIGLVELVFVHQDEKGLGWFTHGMHAVPVAMVFTFIAMNLHYVSNLAGYPLQENFYVDLGVRVLLGLVAAIKVKAAAAVVSGRHSVGEKLGHALIVGALIAASPYIWAVIYPVVPAWLEGGA